MLMAMESITALAAFGFTTGDDNLEFISGRVAARRGMAGSLGAPRVTCDFRTRDEN
jgi:hypothetical protein